MFHGPYFYASSTMQAGTTPIFNVFGMTGHSSSRELNPQNLLISAGSPLLSPFTISRGYWGPIRYQGAPSGAPTLDPHGVDLWWVFPETLYHSDDALLYIAYVMLIWAVPIPADRWHCSLWP